MEKDNKRYANGKIYSLRSHQTDDINIGSTIQPLYKMLYVHKRIKHNKLTKYSDLYIELIEEIPCYNKMDLERKRNEYIRNNINCINFKKN